MPNPERTPPLEHFSLAAPSAAQARRLASHPDPYLRAHLASDAHLAPELQRVLASDHETPVRAALTRNRDLLPATQLFLARDADVVVRHALVLNARLTSDACVLLSGDPVPVVRHALAQRVEPSPDLDARFLLESFPSFFASLTTGLDRETVGSLLLGWGSDLSSLLIAARVLSPARSASASSSRASASRTTQSVTRSA